MGLCKLLSTWGLLLVLAGAARPAPSPEAPPNLVVIVWNDANFERLGWVGGTTSTPRLDALVAEGARFPAGLQAGSRGRPTWTQLVTGRASQAHGITYQTGPKRLEGAGTLGVLLEQQGYATLHVGKVREGPAKALGFGRMLEDVLPDGAGPTAAFVEEFAGKQPLFVLWSPAVPEGFGAKNLDAALGVLLDALDRTGQRANTLFAFLTNGESRGLEFSALECGEARMQNPMALVWPGRIPPGEHTESVTPLDLFPTLLDCLQIPRPVDLLGVSLRPWLEGADLPRRTLGASFFTHQPSPASKGGRENAKDLLALVLRDGPWKYALFFQDLGVEFDARAERMSVALSSGDQRLFDLATDPAEARDLSGDPAHAVRLATLRAAALEWWRAGGGTELELPFLPPPLGAPPKEARPNIVLVVADDMDNEHLGFLGNPRAATPTLDALAREGVLFPVAHVPMSRCRPSLAALLSGRWPLQSGIFDNAAARLLARRDSLPNLLKAAGYATFQGGKFWEGSPFSMGFLGPERSDPEFRDFVRQGQEELFAFIDHHHAERPLFLWWAPMLPHKPFDPPARFVARFRDVEVPVPDGLQGDPEAYRAAERTAYAMGAWLDEGLADLRAKLASVGELEDTLFVFLIDNGLSNGHPSKGTAFEKGLSTPIVFSWPKGLAGGRTRPELLSTLDLYPTLLDYAGIPCPPGAAGIDLRATLEGRAPFDRERLHGALYSAREGAGPQKADELVYALYTRTPRWKFVQYVRNVRPENFFFHHEFAPFPTRGKGEIDLFDLEADPYEREDLSGDPALAGLVEDLRAGALAWWQQSGGGDLDLWPAPGDNQSRQPGKKRERK